MSLLDKLWGKATSPSFAFTEDKVRKIVVEIGESSPIYHTYIQDGDVIVSKEGKDIGVIGFKQIAPYAIRMWGEDAWGNLLYTHIIQEDIGWQKEVRKASAYAFHWFFIVNQQVPDGHKVNRKFNDLLRQIN